MEKEESLRAENEILRYTIDQKELQIGFHSTLLMSKSKEELITNIHEQFSRFFHFSHCSLMLLNEHGTSLRPYMIDPASKLRNHPLFNWVAHHDFAVNDGINNLVMDATEPVLLRVSDYIDQTEVPAYIPIIKESGLNEVLAMPLTTESGAIGMLCFFSEQQNAFDPKIYPLVQSAAPVIAKSTVSFLRQDEIRRRDAENEAIMALNNRLIAIRTKEDFIEIINQDLRSYIPYDENNLLLYVRDRQVYRLFSFDVLPERLNDPVFRAMSASDYPDMNSLRQSHLPQITNVIEVANAGIGWAKVVYQMGVRQIMHLKLLDGNQVVGQLVLMSHKDDYFTKAHLSLLQQITYQLAKGMANILAVLEIQRREKESQLLLEISNAMNSVRGKDDLLPAIKPLLQTTLSFSDICISCYNFAKGTYQVFARDNSKTVQHPEWKSIEGAEFPIKDGMHNTALVSDQPVFFKYETLSKMNQPHIEFILKAGIREVACVRLKSKNEIIGSLVLLAEQERAFLPEHLGLLSRLSHHLATAVSNIIANQRIEAQLVEINRYKEQLEDEKHYLQEEANAGYSQDNIIGTGPEMQKVFDLLSQVSFTNSTVLILGETGTGKELIARALHDSSGRSDKLMVKVNCAAIPANLVESELFGHERGSFTGATERRVGKFELANNGTLFLDEIGEMPLEMQVKLLRAIQEREFERVGGKETIKVNVRLIAATNRDLKMEVQQGRFRSDLYYRLNVFPIVLPALRDHKEDIPDLARFFLNKYSKNIGRRMSQISDKAMGQLMDYSWPGNVRELEHVIERSVLMASGSVLSETHLPGLGDHLNLSMVADQTTLKSFEENEREHIVNALNQCKGKIFGSGGAAEVLKLKVGTLNSKIKKLGITKLDLNY